MNLALYDDVERLIDLAFDKCVPHKQYRIVSADEAVNCQRSVVHVHELPEGFISPFSSTDYDYKLQAIINVANMRDYSGEYPTDFEKVIRLLWDYGMYAGSNAVNTLWAYVRGSEIFEQQKGYPVQHMKAFVATYLHMGWPDTLHYEY